VHVLTFFSRGDEFMSSAHVSWIQIWKIHIFFDVFVWWVGTEASLGTSLPQHKGVPAVFSGRADVVAARRD